MKIEARMMYDARGLGQDKQHSHSPQKVLN